MSSLVLCALLSVLPLQPAAGTPDVASAEHVVVGDLDGDGQLDLYLVTPVDDPDGELMRWALASGARPAPTAAPGAPTHGVDPDSPLGRLLSSSAEGPITTAHDLFASLLVGVYVSIIEAQYVNDNANEVTGADIPDNTLRGPDVSTISGDVTHTGAVLTADQGVFGLGVTVAPNYATVSGGRSNTATKGGATVGGGDFNNATGYDATVGGGSSNWAGQTHATVGGGYGNDATNIYSTVGGGYLNTASGADSTVPGGHRNTAYAPFSFAAGSRARANHQGAFVWGDSGMNNKPSSAANQFNVYASGGTRIFSNGAATSGVLLAPGGNSWSAVSDRDAKEHVLPVDPRAVLDAVAALPISTWNYTSQDDAVRHMGPMAQDFRAAFGLGVSDRLIDTVDPDGVALAAIQGLNARVDEKDAEIAALRAELAGLKARLADDAGR